MKTHENSLMEGGEDVTETEITFPGGRATSWWPERPAAAVPPCSGWTYKAPTASAAVASLGSGPRDAGAAARRAQRAGHDGYLPVCWRHSATYSPRRAGANQ